jgi:hypothetical protein
MDNILNIDSIVDSAGKINLSDKEIDLLYAYLDLELDDMSDEDMMGVDLDGKLKEYTC